MALQRLCTILGRYQDRHEDRITHPGSEYLAEPRIKTTDRGKTMLHRNQDPDKMSPRSSEAYV
jgi:hypothetical protein